MSGGLRRYEFSEQLAKILGESHRDLRFRVTMMVSGGVVKPGPRGRGSPLATPEYGARLLLGTMAAPQQTYTVEAIRCYWNLVPVLMAPGATSPGVVIGPPQARTGTDVSTSLLPSFEALRFGECLSRLLEFSAFESTREGIVSELFGVWINRNCPVAGLQIGIWSEGRRSVITQRFELAEEESLPTWLDPSQGGNADPGLFHTVFLPANKVIEIGMLTTPEQKDSPMLNLGSKNLGSKITKLTDLVNLARQGRYRGQWEKLLSALAQVQAWSDKIGTDEDSRLVEVTGFGSNPGNLRMFKYAPERLSSGAPLVVALHGCTQSAASYDQGAGWSELADRFGFAVLFPQQHWKNNPLRCFNWFRPEDTTRDQGEPLSIRQMVDRMLADYDLDRGQVYVTGLSSGAAMTSAMLATYPDVFAGGAIVAGVPYGAAGSLQEAFESMFVGRSLSERDWGDRVRGASAHQGPWPRISVWHGDEDSSVAPLNAEEIAKQWLDAHGLSSAPAVEDRVDGYPHRMWQDAQGLCLIESYTITGMSHGQPLDVNGGEFSCGTAGPFFNNVGISSTYRIAEFWNLPDALSDRPAQEKSESSAAGETAREEVSGAESVESTPSDAGASSDKPSSSPTVRRFVDADFVDADDVHIKDNGPLGINVQKIITQSLGMAGLLKESGNSSAHSESNKGDPLLGIDVPGIISKSLEAAGVFAQSYKTQPTADGTTETEWRTEGWELIANRSGRGASEPILFGYASSGNDCDIGNKVRSVSREVSLGTNPTLSYIRRLNLNAAVNDYTKARFSVLVDGLAVDEVSVIGMEHAETDWMQRSSIDLTPFANRTVTLTFEVAAHSNVCNEVSAKAWVDRVHVRDVVSVKEV